MPLQQIFLKSGKEKAIRNHHHWIFSGAVDKMPAFDDGDILNVFSSKGELLGSGYFNRKAKIIGRMLCFDDTPPYDAVAHHLEKAIRLRERLFDHNETNAYRLVNGEGDYLPGLVVDKYDDLLVVQISTLGMDKLKPRIIQILAEHFKPVCIYEKSLMNSRKDEGMADFEGVLFGTEKEFVEIRENGLRFQVSPLHGQKTGFFLDHRDMRQMIREIAKGKRVLNCFAYTGGFSVYADAGGALQVETVEISDKALDVAKLNAGLNSNDISKHSFRACDVFAYLRENELNFDLVILDPPAFAKRQKDIITACRGYKDINRVAMQKMPSQSLLLTSSCSHHVDEQLFQKVVFQASVEAKRNVRIIGRHRMAADHPINLCHPETEYLKSLLLYIE